MKTADQISSDISLRVQADESNEVTYVGVKGSFRGYVDAVALAIRDLYHDLTQTKRRILIDTASGEDLDNYVSQRGVTRQGASKAGVLLLFSGTSGTVIPAGTVVSNPTTNIGYVTQEAITLGSKNPSFVVGGEINITTPSIGDVVWAECSVAGVIGRTPANTITQVPISGVTVTNPAPAQGGTDVESDQELRHRYKNYVKLLNKGTKGFYEALVRNLDERVLRVLPEKNYTHPDSVYLNIVPKSGASYTGSKLSILESQVEEFNRAFEDVVVRNVNFTFVSVSFNAILESVNGNPIDADQHFIDTADALASHFNWFTWEWGKAISVDDVFVLCQEVSQVRDIQLTSFKINGSNATSILIPRNSLPYLQSVQITDITNRTSPVTRENTSIVQNYNQLQLEEELV